MSAISKIFDIEDLRYWRSSISKLSLILPGPARAAESECRLQPSTEVAKYRLQCRKFIATQFLAQDLKQYPLRSAWRRRRWSRGLRDWTAAASGDLYRRALAEVPWQSWLAVVHEVTAEQRRPSDIEMMRSLSNRQPPLRKWSWGFVNQLHTEIQAQKINANDYKITKIIWECHGIAVIAYYKKTKDWCHMPKVPKRKIRTQGKAPSSKLWNIPSVLKM